MYDINFFESYLPKPKKTNYLLLFGLLILILLLAGIAYLEYDHYLKVKTMNDKIQKFENDSNSSGVKNELNNFKEKKQIQLELGSTLAKLDVVDTYLNMNKVVYAGLLSDVSRAVPSNCFISQIEIANNTINISGYAESYRSIAQFQHQLRSVERLTYVFAPVMKKTDLNHTFTIACLIQLEVGDESK